MVSRGIISCCPKCAQKSPPVALRIASQLVGRSAKHLSILSVREEELKPMVQYRVDVKVGRLIDKEASRRDMTSDS